MCETGEERTFTQSQPQSGGGASCPEDGPDCEFSDGACVTFCDDVDENSSIEEVLDSLICFCDEHKDDGEWKYERSELTDELEARVQLLKNAHVQGERQDRKWRNRWNFIARLGLENSKGFHRRVWRKVTLIAWSIS